MAEWHSMENLPAIGSKFIALYSDGSGSCMFFRHEGGYIDCEGDEIPALNPKSYDRWIELPQDLEFWCEIRSEDPFTLTPSPSHSETP